MTNSKSLKRSDAKELLRKQTRLNTIQIDNFLGTRLEIQELALTKIIASLDKEPVKRRRKYSLPYHQTLMHEPHRLRSVDANEEAKTFVRLKVS